MFLHADSKDSSLGAHSFCWFCCVAAHFIYLGNELIMLNRLSQNRNGVRMQNMIHLKVNLKLRR